MKYMRWVALLISSCSLLLSAYLTAPHIARMWAPIEAGDDPAASASVQLANELTPTRVNLGIDEALAAGDQELAGSFVALAQEQGIPVDAGRFSAVVGAAYDVSLTTLNFGRGFLTGDGSSRAAVIGQLAADLSGYGDLRDLAGEGVKVARGEEVNHVTVALAIAGLGVSAVTWTSMGAASPVRAGISLIKSVHRAGAMSRPLAAALARPAAGALDRDALKVGFSSLAHLEPRAAMKAFLGVFRPEFVGQLNSLGYDTATVFKYAGRRGASEALALAENSAEVRQAARLAAAKGTKTRAILKVLGRGALITGRLTRFIFVWLIGLLGHLFGAALLARKFGLLLGRMIFRRRRREHRTSWAATRPTRGADQSEPLRLGLITLLSRA